MADYELSEGVAYICPAGMTLGEDQLSLICKNAAAHKEKNNGGAELVGVHLEGPFLALARKGAHDPECLKDPVPDIVDKMLEASGADPASGKLGCIRQITIAPELPAFLQDLGRAGEPMSTFQFWSRLRHWGAGLGLNEAVNYSFVGHKDLDLLGLPAEGRISIMNPLSAEQDALRTVLAPGLLHDLRNNLAQGAAGVRLFELANTFTAAPSDDPHATGASETGMLGVLLYGQRHDSAWPHVEADMDYSDLKGIVEHLLHFLNLSAPVCELAESHPYLLPCVRLSVDGTEVGVMGRVRPEMADSFHARKDVWLAELNLDVLRRLHDAAQVRFQSLAVFPPVRRDITVAAPVGVTVGAILDQIMGQKQPLLEGAVLVDSFSPEGSDERNLTFRLTFRHAERTLKDAEVDKVREKVAQSLVQELGVRI